MGLWKYIGMKVGVDALVASVNALEADVCAQAGALFRLAARIQALTNTVGEGMAQIDDVQAAVVDVQEAVDAVVALLQTLQGDSPELAQVITDLTGIADYLNAVVTPVAAVTGSSE